MEWLIDLLRRHEWLLGAWRAVAWASAAYLVALGALALMRPAIVRRFFDGFVRTPAVNLLEASLRAVAGLAFMGAAPETRLPDPFFWFGAVLAATSIPMAFLYRFHKRQAAWAAPFAKRVLPLIGVLSVAMGGLVAWGLS
ncbi:MAG: hypothetical protein HXY23_05955 [Parvularculaceae bacterium]|jgi:hypothetical protein|nr:hypothetical protein [Parvularculaceae bacterium]